MTHHAAQTIRVGVAGYGYWGPNLVRNFYALPGSTVTMVADLDEKRLSRVNPLYPTIKVTTDPMEMMHSPDVDAVAIATPVSTHFELAKAAIEAGKHVLIEKPITRTSDEARQLIELAEKHRVVLMVDHTFVYTGAVRKMRELAAAGELGDLYYFDSTRINFGLLRGDIDVVWDLAVHDLSILDYLIDDRPVTVQAFGSRHVTTNQAEIASITLRYANGFHAHIRVSWLSPVKMRLALLAGSRKMIVYDDVHPSEKLKVYDRSFDFDTQDDTAFKPVYRAGDVFIPSLDRAEALETEAKHFLSCVRDGSQPLTDGRAGLRLVQWLEAAQRSMESNGAFVSIEV